MDESTVELIVTGQVGLNLQATKKQTGAFVDSFYKGHDADGQEIILPAESTFGAQLIGAIISSVNGEDVTGFQAMTVCQIISKAERPLTLKFLVDHQNIEYPLEIENFAALPWLLEHLDELSTSSSENRDISSESISLLKKSVLSYADCVRVLQNLEVLRKHDSGNLIKFEETMTSRFCKEKTSFETNGDEEISIIAFLRLQKDLLCKELMPSFVKSIAMKRMSGYLFNFPSYPKLAFSDILRSKTLLFHFFAFLSRSNRRHILLLCYINLMENGGDVLNNLVLCSTALDICKETALLSLKGRADQIIKILRTPIVTSVPEIPNSEPYLTNARFVRIPDYHKQATKLCSDVMNCLAWEYTLALYPSFETSKDYTILHSYILNQDEESSETKNRVFRSKEGSLNDLIRTKKLPSSLTVHRRAKVDIVTSSTAKGSTDSFSIIKFDTSVNEYNSQRTKTVQFVTTSITEEECSSASVQVSGDVSQFDMAHERSLDMKDGLDNADGLNALVPFFLPTGKAVIPYVGTNRHVAQNFHPTPKLYSMVLKARDQTAIYACSLVLYRPVLLVEDFSASSTFTVRRIGDGVGGPKLYELDDTANKKVGIPLVEGDTPKPMDKSVSANSNNAVVPQQGSTTARSKVSMTVREEKLSTILEAGFEHMGPSHAEQVCSERSITNDSATFIIPTLKELKLKLPAVIQTSSSGPTDAVFVSEMTATTPAVISLLSCSPRDVLSPIGILSPVVISTAADANLKVSSTFSDDESAGLSSSVISHDQQIPSSNTATHIHKKPAVGVMKLYPQGAFTDFLSATANATVSVASAIALQAGSLPSYINASKSSEQKGFYDFSRFKTMNFATNTPVQFENASKLKRKYEGIAVLDPSVTDVDTSLSVEFNSLRLSASSLPFSPTILDKNHSSQWNFSPEKTMSSYPRFGAAKSMSKKSTSPRIPSWSPGQRTAGHNHNRKLRSHVQGNARKPFAHNLNRDVLGSISSSETNSTTHFDCARTITSLETNPRGLTAAMHDPNVGSNLAAKSGSAELAPPLSRCTNDEDFSAEKEVKGVAYVAYGFALLTDVPMIGRLREAASNAALEFVNAHNPLNIGDSSVLQDKNTLSHLIAKCARPSLKVEKDYTSSPNATLLHDSDPDLTMCSTSNSAEQSGDYDSSIVFDALSPKNLVTVLIAFLLEYRIVAVSSRTLSASTHLGEWLKDAIQPLKYAHVYSPLVPPCIGLQLIHCPAPFFIGMKRTSKIDEVVESEDERDREKIKGRRGKTAGSKDSTCGLLLVDLDRDECSMPQDLCLLVKSARVLIRALEDLLYPQLCCCDEVIGIEKESKGSVKGYQALNLCRKFVGSLLEGSRRSCLRAEDGDEHIVIFDEVLFMQQHFTRLSLHPTVVAKSNQSEKQNIAEAEYTIVDEVRFDGTSLLPLTVSGGKDIEKLLRSLIITQCFSLYLTS